MKIRILSTLPFLLVLSFFTSGKVLADSPAMKMPSQIERYGSLPLTFEANIGQADPKVAFLSRGDGYTLFLAPQEAVLGFHAILTDQKYKNPKQSSTYLRMKLIGGNASSKILGEDLLAGKTNYFVGNDPRKWRTDIPSFTKVKYKNIYPGIDLVYYGNQRKLEYDLVVKPGADPNAIRLSFEGSDFLRLDLEGNLLISLAGREISLLRPHIYQKKGGEKQVISGSYVIEAKNQIAFKVAPYDRQQALIIDPVLSYSTYLGGELDEHGKDIAVDGSGNAYIVGITYSAAFPTTPGAFKTSLPQDSSYSVFVTKMNAAGNALIYSTYLGEQSTPATIAVDASGNALIAGQTFTSDFPTAHPMQGNLRGHSDAFVTKLNASGNALLYSTYLGGDNDDYAASIAVDASGNAYLTGSTSSMNFPLANPIKTILSFGQNAFVTKINPNGSALIYSTYLGGNSFFDTGKGISVDASGSAYVTGAATSADFPTTPGAFQTVKHSAMEAFVTKLNPSGNALVYSTFLGGPDGSVGNGIAIDPFGNAYITGFATKSFPTTPGAVQTGSPNQGGAFVTKLNPSGNSLVYSTLLRGSTFDRGIAGYAISVDLSGHAYVMGKTHSSDFPTADPIKAHNEKNTCPPLEFPHEFVTCEDLFITKLSSSGDTLIFSTYLGGSFYDFAGGMAIDRSGNIYVTGTTRSSDYPITQGAFQTQPQGGAFVTKIAVTQSSSDAFNRANATNIGSNWNEYLGDLEIFNNQVRNTTTNNKAAIFTKALGPDQSVSVDCKVTEPGNACGVMARWSSESNFYRARLDVGRQDVVLLKTVNGVTTRLGAFTRPLSFDTFYPLRLVVRGSKVSVYFANESMPGISVTDKSLPTGNFAGIRSYASAVHTTLFENFDVTTPLIDTFNRSNSSNLGSSWSEYLSDLEIFDGAVRNANGGGQSKAARYLISVGPDQEVASDCKLTAAGNSCGVMARWSNPNNFYHVRLDVGQQNVVLFKTVNGITNKLGQFSRPLNFNTYYRLRLIVKGSSLSVFFANEGSTALSVVDTALASGSYAGIRSYATVANTTYFNNFSTTVAP